MKDYTKNMYRAYMNLKKEVATKTDYKLFIGTTGGKHTKDGENAENTRDNR